MPLEILHGALVLFGGGTRLEGSEIAALAGFRIHLSGIKPVFTRLQFSDHGIAFESNKLSFSTEIGGSGSSEVGRQTIEPPATCRQRGAMTSEESAAEVAEIIAETAKLPLNDASLFAAAAAPAARHAERPADG